MRMKDAAGRNARGTRTMRRSQPRATSHFSLRVFQRCPAATIAANRVARLRKANPPGECSCRRIMAGHGNTHKTDASATESAIRGRNKASDEARTRSRIEPINAKYGTALAGPLESPHMDKLSHAIQRPELKYVTN